ncbi:hypothetical protein [Treponema sp.]|uniref:hypothetical protein n=1 Tax=Treponema sp. TaxID=166 RepID=UPI003FA252D2
MKRFSGLKLYCLLALFSYIFVACSSHFMNPYYFQQQNRRGQGNGDSLLPDWGGDEPSAPSEQPLDPGKISMFSVILPDGKIAEPNHDTTVRTQLTGKLSAEEGFPFGSYPSSRFTDWKFSSNFSSADVPEMRYSGTVTWEGSDDEQWYNGSDASAGSNTIYSMKYFRYCGKNPFNLYANEKYDLYGEDGNPTGEKELLMKRFVFYRFTGKGGGLVALNNCLIAVDTYTKLVFSFAKPVAFQSVFGNNVPTKWAPVDTASTGSGGKKYRFYQYDPIGYVTDDGVFHLNDTYKTKQGSGNYDPTYTEKSPYLGYVGNASGENNSYVISGTLTVKAKYLKNISVTDGTSDNFDGLDEPEFIYGIRSRSYEGTAVSHWDVLSAHKPNQPGIMPAAAQHIKKGTSLELGESKEYKFEGAKVQRTLELDARVTEIDIGAGSNDEITDYEKPVIYLRYDGFSQSWKPAGTNDTYINGPIVFDENFELPVGQVKDFVITLRAPEGQQMELCYELSWSTSGGSSEKPAFGVRAQKNGDDAQYGFSGDNGVYTVEYRDTSDESAREAKTVSFALNVFNLKAGIPLKAVYSTEKADFPLNPVFKAEDTVLANPIFSTENAVIDVSLSLPAKVGSEQNGKVIFTFTDENSAYDMPNSPDKIEINVIRRAYKIIPAAELSISNPRLKNISIKDSHLSSKYQFAYTLKTAYNNEDWKPFSNSTKTVTINEEASLEGEYTWSVDEPHNDKHVVRLSAEIWEEDTISANDVIIKHGKPVIELRYDSLTDSWSPFLNLSAYFEDNDGKWEVKSVSMDTLTRGNKRRMTISISAYIWESVKDWGDMELSFDVEWK